MANFTDPIKAAFGWYLNRFYADLVADTPSLAEFAGRGFAKSAVWAPGRMIDQVEELLAAWRKNDTSGQDKATPYLPIMIAAMSKDYIPAPPEFGRPIADPVDVMIPGDPKGRVFKMRAALCDVRVQVSIIAADEPTAKSIAMQLDLFAKATENRRLYSVYSLIGMNEPWPVVLEMPELQAISSPTEAKNLTILTVDIQMRATVPMLIKPKPTEPSDHEGTGTDADPDGFLVVTQADGTNSPWPGVPQPTTWTEATP